MNTQPYVLRRDLDAGIAEIEFFHPAHNSLPSYLLDQLANQIEACGLDNKVSVIILRSGGERTFCAGASFEELITIESLEEGKQFFSGFGKVINACRKCPKLIIGRVQGKAVGGGVGLAASVDYCIATQYAGVKLSELNVGIGPFVVGPAVERKIGLSAMTQLTINANEFYDAEWARSKGLYAEVHVSAEAMDRAIAKLSDYLAQTNPEARAALKQVFWSGTEHWDQLLSDRAEISGKLVLSKETKNALAKFRK